MPKRTDIHSILVIGAGPIVIGQACEFDYSGTQAIKALKSEGYKVILVNSNPATIMTDPEFADRTYIEPIQTETLRQIIELERPDALLPTVGGQTALNAAVDLAKAGILEEFGVELIGANLKAIQKGEDRLLFRDAMDHIGLNVPISGLAHTIEEAMDVAEDIGLPVIIRPAFTLGGTGGGVAYNREEFRELADWGLDQSPVSEILIEESVLGWKEFELEVVRDTADNVIIICSIENLDAMGVHTGDSITVAPAQTLTDKEYQRLRDAAIRIIREIGVDTGGSNIQFAINPDDGRLVIIEMNPRVSRSSALASKATGFPIAKIAAKLAVGYTLDELTNDITGDTPASFEPTIDYVVTKIPRFAFEKFPGSTDELTTQMRSVGEIMSIGRTFAESLQKGLRSLEIGTHGFDDMYAALSDDELRQGIRRPNSRRIWQVAEAFRREFTINEVHDLSHIDPWFLSHIQKIIEQEKAFPTHFAHIGTLDDEDEQLRQLTQLILARKQEGFSDKRLAQLLGKNAEEIRKLRKELHIFPRFRCVDTCGGEFVARTPYLYSSYDQGHETLPPRNSDQRPVVILGGGPNRIGQGIEFDYCCVHACFAIQEAGLEAVMVNCNPETVSTDYDTSDRLYFEPLTEEDVLHILEAENPRGVILQFGGQTPLKLALGLEQRGIPILGTPPKAIDRAEDRDLFNQMCENLGIRQPPSGIARSIEEALHATERIGYPVVVRPSYVLGGRAMEIVYNDEDLHRYMREAVQVSEDHPVLIDHFLEAALEIDVDIIYDGQDMIVGGIMEHIEQAGIHSGDSACILPAVSLSETKLAQIRDWSHKMAHELGVIGLMNIQYALQGNDLYVLEVNPRASRTVPFVSKSTGMALAKIATRVMLGTSLKELDIQEVTPDHYNVKETIFPFNKFPGVDTLLGPEMRSTGEVMGSAIDLYEAFSKAQSGVHNDLPTSGAALVSIADKDKEGVLPAIKLLQKEGFTFYATGGTASYLAQHGIEAISTMKVSEGRPHVVDIIKNGDVSLVLNTPKGGQAHQDAVALRSAALKYGIPYFTTTEGAVAAAHAISHLTKGAPRVLCLQDVLRS